MHTPYSHTVLHFSSVCTITYHPCWIHTLGDYNGKSVMVSCNKCVACRPSVHGCLKGTAGLQAAAAVQLQPNQTAMLVKALVEVQISSLPQADRMMALTILSTALKVVPHDLRVAYRQHTRHSSTLRPLINPAKHTCPCKQACVWLQNCWDLTTHTSGRYNLQKGYFGESQARWHSPPLQAPASLHFVSVTSH